VAGPMTGIPGLIDFDALGFTEIMDVVPRTAPRDDGR